MVNQTRDAFFGKFSLFAMLAIIAISVAVYGQLAGFDFINYDDPYFIGLNKYVTSGIRFENVHWALGSREMGIWHPLTWISYQFETSLFGEENPEARHVVNLGIHLCNSLLVYMLCLRLTGRRWASLFVALLFSIHPQHVQPVAWISERKELLSALFFLASVYLYVIYRILDEKVWRYILALIAFVLALLCKPSVTPLPLVLVFIDLYFRRSVGRNHLLVADRPGFKISSLFRNIAHKLPFFIASGTASGVAIYLKKTSQWADVETTWHLGRRLLLMPIGLLHYIKSLFIPWPNQFWIEPPPGTLFLASVSALAVIVLLGFAIWRLRHRVPELVFGFLWFVVMWLPVSGIVLVSNYYVADRYTYLPYIGCFIGIVFLLRSVKSSSPAFARSFIVLGAVVVLLFSVLAYRQTGYWRDSVTLFERELELNPHSAEAPVYLGQALLVREKHKEALEHFITAIERNPANPLAFVYKGDAMRALGREEDAVEAYREAIELNTSRAEPYSLLGMLLTKRGKLAEAVEILNRGLEKHPSDLYLLNHAGYAYGFGLNQPVKALNYYRKALSKAPSDTHALHGAGVLYLKTGQTEKGVALLEKLLEIEPANDLARSALLSIRK